MLTFGLFSDLHNSKGDFENVMNNIFELTNGGETLNAVVMVGDIVYHPSTDSVPSTESYAMINANEKFSKIKSEGRLVFAMGNHEFPLHANERENCRVAKEVFVRETGLTPEKVTVFEGYHFITAGPDTYRNDLSEEQERFITDSVKAALESDPVKPVFLIIHQPVDGTLPGTASYDFYSAELEEFLKSQPRLVVFSGHMHHPSSDPQSIYQVPGGATFVYTSSLMGGNGAKPPYVTERHSNWPCQAIMMHIDTDTNIITLKRFYVSEKPEYLEGGDWVLDIPAMMRDGEKAYKYTDARKELSVAPYFKSGDALTVTEIGENSARVIIPTPEQGAEGEDSVVAYYNIELFNKTENKLEKSMKVLSDYFLKDKSKLFSYNFFALPDSTKWEIKVTPVTPWLVEGSNSLTAEFETSEPLFDEVDFDEEYTAKYNVMADAEINGSKTVYGSFIMILHAWRTLFDYTVEINTPGTYRIFLETSAKGNTQFNVTVYDSDKNIIGGGSNITNTGGYTEFKFIPHADVTFEKPGTYTVACEKPVGNYTVSVRDMMIRKVVK